MATTQEPDLAELPEVDFTTFVLSLGASVLHDLGELQDDADGDEPTTPGGTPKDLPMAKHTIDTLAMLQEKTRGNLSEDESNILDGLLTELRMKYVQASRGNAIVLPG